MNGLAVMATDLAYARVYGRPEPSWRPSSRNWCAMFAAENSASREYYRIIDRISAGQKP